MRGRFGVVAAVIASVCVVAVAACGGSSGGSSSSSSSGGGQAQTKGAKAIDPNSMNGAKGNVTYCTGKDTTGVTHAWIKAFNAQKNGVTVKLLEFPTSADAQRTQFIQRQQAKSGECDIFSSDVVWTAEFASQKWLYDMTPYITKRKSEFIQAPLQTVTFEGKQWGVPETSDAAFLFYRDDVTKTPPTTWQQAYQQAKGKGGIVYQGAAYEGLTCDFLELAFAAGGQVLSPDGKKAAIDSPQNVKALQFMMDGIKQGVAPRAVTTYMEPQADASWATGKPAMMRNWSGSYQLAQKAPKIKNKFKVTPFPAFQGGGKAGILGGHNSVISVYSKNPGAALKAVDYISSNENQVRTLAQFSIAAVTSAAYDSSEVKKAIPFSDQLKQAISQAKARPVSPVYPQISQAIYNNVNDALSGRATAQDAMKKAQSQITNALSTF
jgi:multiple sugar transport system substrate-binding protein